MTALPRHRAISGACTEDAVRAVKRLIDASTDPHVASASGGLAGEFAEKQGLSDITNVLDSAP